MRQLTLNAPLRALVRRSDPATARAAARRTDGKGLAAQVLAELVARGPGTAHELAERMGLSLVTVSPRMAPLERAGSIKRIGVRDRRTLWEAMP